MEPSEQAESESEVAQESPTLCDPMTVACQDPLSMGFSRQEYWSGLPCPSAGDLPDPGIKPVSPVAPALQEDSLPLSHRGSPNLYMFLLNFYVLQVEINQKKTIISHQDCGFIAYTVSWNVIWCSYYGKQ